MFRKYFIEFSPLLKLLIVIMIIFVVFITMLILGLVIAIPIFGIKLSNMSELFNSDGNLNFIRYMQVLQGFALFIVPSILVGLLFSFNFFDYLQLSKKPKLSSLINVVIIVIVSLPLINLLAEFNANINLPSIFEGIENKMKAAEESAKVLTERLLMVDNYPTLFFNIFMIAIIPAIGEELLFRGVLQKLLSQTFKNHHIGIIITAFLFSALHFQFYGFIPRMFLGILFGYLLVWSKSLYLPIIAHFTNNAFAVVTYFYINKGNIPQEAESFGSNKETTIFALISLILMSVLLFVLYKTEKIRK